MLPRFRGKLTRHRFLTSSAPAQKRPTYSWCRELSLDFPFVPHWRIRQSRGPAHHTTRGSDSSHAAMQVEHHKCKYNYCKIWSINVLLIDTFAERRVPESRSGVGRRRRGELDLADARLSKLTAINRPMPRPPLCARTASGFRSPPTRTIFVPHWRA